MKRLLAPTLAALTLSVVALGAGACGSDADEQASAADTLTRRQKDSLISTMPIPGAGAVGRALDAQDAAAARAAQHDSIP